MNKKMPWIQLARYFSGELHREEKKEMENWIKADPERAKQVNELYHIWNESEIPPYELSVDDAWAKLSKSMDSIEKRKKDKKIQTSVQNYRTSCKSLTAHNHRTKKRQQFGRTRRLIIAAASILILISAGLYSYYLSTEQNMETIAEDRTVLTTEYGERATYSLSDGSRVILHAGSRLEIPESYNNENRELYLEGEAYFEAAHNPEKPFIVHSHHSYTKVVGTQFLVQAWKAETDQIEVVVSEGRVLFGDSRSLDTENVKEVMVSENQRAVITGDKAPLVTYVDDINWYLGWTDGKLVFEDRPLGEVLPRLERWYNLEIIALDEEISEKRITAEIDYTLSMSEVLHGLAMAFDLEMERDNRTITFKKNYK